MKMIKLEKLNEPEFDELFKMIEDLKDFLNEDANLDDCNWMKNFNAIIDFQDSDGSFKLLNSRMPTEAVIDFIYIPTYICSAILMKALMSDSDAFTLREKSALSNGLKVSCARNLRGHGYEALKSQIESLNIFMKAGLREFMDLHSDLCPEFSEMIRNIITKFGQMESEGQFLGPWKENFEDDIRAINRYFSQRKVFVYGTLMSGETNHNYLQNSDCLGLATIEGYDMYDVGWYPAIVPGDNTIMGELYQASKDDMSSIDMLEGEGSLYAKKCERVTTLDGNSTFAFIYVYLRDISELERIPAWKDYVWYVSYGSNMLEERFLRYIKGGSYKNSRDYPSCDDTSLPKAIKTFEIPYDMYFGMESGTWGGGVSFLDTTKKGKAFGVAYLITREQFNHVAFQENFGRYPGGGEWYEDIIGLGKMDGIEVITITNNELRPYFKPRKNYLDTLRKGIREHWPEITDEEIEDYLNRCIRL